MFEPETGWFKEPEHALVYVIGVGGGSDEEAALAWGGRVIFLEPDLNRLASWYKTKGAQKMLVHPRHEVHLLDEAICGELGRRFAMPSDVVSLERYRDWTEPVRQVIWGEADATRRIKDELVRGGDLFYRNFYTNLKQLDGALDASGLWGQYTGIPAVVCGAGPSLPEALPIEGALLIAAGSGLQAMEANGARPHFAVAIDPHRFQISRFSGARVPVFYRGRWCPEALSSLEGPRLYVRGAGGYPVVEWFEDEIGISGPVLEEGPTATCLAVEVARALGCDPIYTAGVDLEWRGSQLYAPGVKYAPEELIGFDAAKWATERQWLRGKVEPLVDKLPGRQVRVDLSQVPRLEPEVTVAVARLRASLMRCLELIGDQETPRVICEVELLEELAYQLICEPIKRCVSIDEFTVLKQNLRLINECAL